MKKEHNPNLNYNVIQRLVAAGEIAHQLVTRVSNGNGAWWFVGGYGTETNRSSFYWYRNILGYPETARTLDSFWYIGQPDNNGEFILAINTLLFNDLAAKYPSGFVCQVDPSLPMPPSNNINGSIISSPSATCQSPWVAIDKLYYYLITTPFANVSSAVDGCKRSDPRATLPDFRDLTQWKAVLNYLVQIPIDSRPSTRHRIYPLGYKQVSPGQWRDTKGNWVFSDWLPYYPDNSDLSKNCVMIVDYNGYMWENRMQYAHAVILTQDHTCPSTQMQRITQYWPICTPVMNYLSIRQCTYFKSSKEIFLYGYITIVLE
uniref:C-type lectin domain-containing protein n=1 Tax=Romanomermis culicivorax TaxID=13658 RepID=A0A915KUX2_ROMCU